MSLNTDYLRVVKSVVCAIHNTTVLRDDFFVAPDMEFVHDIGMTADELFSLAVHPKLRGLFTNGSNTHAVLASPRVDEFVFNYVNYLCSRLTIKNEETPQRAVEYFILAHDQLKGDAMSKTETTETPKQQMEQPLKDPTTAWMLPSEKRKKQAAHTSIAKKHTSKKKAVQTHTDVSELATVLGFNEVDAARLKYISLRCGISESVLVTTATHLYLSVLEKGYVEVHGIRVPHSMNTNMPLSNGEDMETDPEALLM